MVINVFVSLGEKKHLTEKTIDNRYYLRLIKKRRKKMTNTTTRKQLFTAVAMLLVAAIALGTATYAWFVNNTAVGVEQMDFQASASSSMEISLPDGAWDGTIGNVGTGQKGWTGILATKDVKAYHGVTPESTTFGAVMPASSADASSFFTVSDWDNTTLKATTFAAITDFKNSSQGAIMIPMYIRSSEDMDVYLRATGSAVANSPLVSDDGGNISTALRVAVVPSTKTGTIFEPNSATDKVTTRKNTTAMGTAIEKKEAVVNVGGSVSDQPTKDPTTYTFLDKDANGVISAGDVVPTGGKLFDLTKNTPQLVYVYVWLEGCDWDCVSEVSKDKYKINLNFMGVPKGTVAGPVS